MTTLMERIKVKSYQTMNNLDKIKFIESIRALRSKALEEARLNKAGGLTRSAKKNRKKRGRSPVNQKAKATKVLAKLTPTELAKLQAMFGE